MNVVSKAVPNHGSRVMPLPFATAWFVETHDWQSSTLTLRRLTDKQRIVMNSRAPHFGLKQSGAGVRRTVMPVVAVLAHVDLWAMMPMSA